MATWAKGIDFKNNSNTTRIGGVGMYGVDNAVQKIYLGFGSEPWGSTGLELTSSNLTFKGNKIYHAGDKPTAADVGALTQSAADGRYVRQANANGYWGMTANGDASNWVRTTVNGIIPYQSGGSGSLGTSSWPFTNIYANNIYDNGTLLENKFSPISHTHNYAGSSSAGGAATTALTCTGNSATATTSSYLGASSRMDYGWNGVNYFNISGTAGAAAKANDTPSTAWWHIMRFNHANGTGYYTDLAVPFNDVSLYYKRITAGSVQNGGWIRVLDSLNYNSYAPTKTGGGASGTWGISVNGNSATTTKLATARTLTIGNTGKNFDGTGNVAWSLAEIGAAASNHSHSYLPLSGGTVSGNFIVNSSKVPALATKVSSSELFTTKITVAGDYTAWANQTALSGVIITQNGITTPGISSGAIDASGESRFFNQTYSDPWNGTSCAIKATGYIASTHSIMSKGKFILGNSPNMYGGLGYDTTSGDVYVANAVNNWLRLKSNQTMTYAGYEVFTSKDRGNIMTVATRISNLNVKLNSGWYAWSNNATGRPADYGVMLVIQWGSDGDFCQIAVSTGNSMWTRWYVNNAWTSWIGH